MYWKQVLLNICSTLPGLSNPGVMAADTVSHTLQWMHYHTPLPSDIERTQHELS